MNYESEKYKSVEQLRKQLHNVASCPPAIDPFSRQGRQEWEQYAETCRELESELRNMGEVF